MDITVKKTILDGLTDYMAGIPLQTGLTLSVVGKAPYSPTYPMLKLSEARNLPMPMGYDYRQRISSLGYEVNIYMPNDELYDKEEVVRTIMFYSNQYLSDIVGLRMVSMNYFDDEPYRGQAMYSCVYFENKKIIY